MNDAEIINKFRENRFSMISMNIRSLTKHLSELRHIASKLKPDIIALQEIWKPHEPFVSIPDYHNIIMNVRPPGKTGGGTAIYVKKSLKIKKINALNDIKLKKMELTSIIVTSNKYEVLILSLHRPPDCTITDTKDDLDKILSKIGNQSIVITGDLNIDYSKYNTLKEMYDQKLLDNNLIQHVRQYTRITSKSKSSIDHTVSNINSIKSFVCETAVADHQMIATCWGKKSLVDNTKNSSNGNYMKRAIHYSKTLEKLNQIDWQNWHESSNDQTVNEMYNSFNSKMQESLVFETKKMRKSKQSQPWFTKEIFDLKKEVEKARKKFLKKSDHFNENEYKNLKRKYNKQLKVAKNDFYANKLKLANNDSKKVWGVINDLLSRKKYKDDFKGVTFDNEEQTDEDIIAKSFSEYYKHAAYNKIKDIKSDKNFTDFLDQKDQKFNTFKFKQIDIQDTWRYIQSIQPKCSSGFDCFPSKLLKMAAPSLLKPLTTIINKCFEDGEFPDLLKNSKIYPVFKKGLPECCNFRPVALLSCFSKVIEKGIKEQFENYMNEQYDNRFQFAYKKNHGTCHSVILTRHITETELDNKKFVLIIMIDLSQAFDTINTDKILMDKLKFYGANQKARELFKSFFTQRKHYTEWKNSKSESVDLFNYSVVQGSTLGPPMYNFYTSDLKNAVNSYLVMFADDKNVIVSDKDPNNAIRKANIELNNIDQYMAANKLIINKGKTSYLMLKPKGAKKFTLTEKLKIGNEEIKQVSEARYLGVILDEKLNFKKQYESVKNKLESTVRALICTRNLLNYRAKFQLYNALFESHVNYCAISYMDKLSKGQIQNLKRLQKKAIRLIFNASKFSHTDNLFKLANITPIEKLYEHEAIKFVFKNFSELSAMSQPVAIRDILLNNSEKTKYLTRFDDDTTKIRPKNHKTGQCVFSLITKWNNANSNLRNAGNLFSLKRMLKNELSLNIKECMQKECFSCKVDGKRDFAKYMKI